VAVPVLSHTEQKLLFQLRHCPAVPGGNQEAHVATHSKVTFGILHTAKCSMVLVHLSEHTDRQTHRQADSAHIIVVTGCCHYRANENDGILSVTSGKRGISLSKNRLAVLTPHEAASCIDFV